MRLNPCRMRRQASGYLHARVYGQVDLVSTRPQNKDPNMVSRYDAAGATLGFRLGPIPNGRPVEPKDARNQRGAPYRVDDPASGLQPVLASFHDATLCTTHQNLSTGCCARATYRTAAQCLSKVYARTELTAPFRGGVCWRMPGP